MFQVIYHCAYDETMTEHDNVQDAAVAAATTQHVLELEEVKTARVFRAVTGELYVIEIQEVSE